MVQESRPKAHAPRMGRVIAVSGRWSCVGISVRAPKSRRKLRTMEVQNRQGPAFGVARITMGPHERIKAEAGAMMATIPTVKVEAKAEGGILKSLKRAVLYHLLHRSCRGRLGRRRGSSSRRHPGHRSGAGPAMVRAEGFVVGIGGRRRNGHQVGWI